MIQIRIHPRTHHLNTASHTCGDCVCDLILWTDGFDFGNWHIFALSVRYVPSRFCLKLDTFQYELPFFVLLIMLICHLL